MKQEMKILDLILKGKWYDMIASGEKPEEYRDIKPYWIKRIMRCRKWCGVNPATNISRCLFPNRCVNTYDFRNISGGFTHVRFHRGYTSTTMLYECENITISKGNPQWGAPTDREVFIIKLGERITN